MIYQKQNAAESLIKKLIQTPNTVLKTLITPLCADYARKLTLRPDSFP
jgi:hypothetical protein